jgi:hypothetical protein
MADGSKCETKKGDVGQSSHRIRRLIITFRTPGGTEGELVVDGDATVGTYVPFGADGGEVLAASLPLPISGARQR